MKPNAKHVPQGGGESRTFELMLKINVHFCKQGLPVALSGSLFVQKLVRAARSPASRWPSLLRRVGSRPRPLLPLLHSTPWRITQVTSFSPSHPHFLLLTAAPLAPPPSPQAPPPLGRYIFHHMCKNTSPATDLLTDCSSAPATLSRSSSPRVPRSHDYHWRC